MRRRESPLNEFGEFFEVLCKRAQTTPYAAGLAAGIRSRSRMSYAMRAEPFIKRRPTTLPVETMLNLAKAVRATPDETEHLIALGVKQHAPPVLRKYVDFLERDNHRLRTELNRGPHRFKFL